MADNEAELQGVDLGEQGAEEMQDDAQAVRPELCCRFLVPAACLECLTRVGRPPLSRTGRTGLQGAAAAPGGGGGDRPRWTSAQLCLPACLTKKSESKGSN